MSSTYTPSPTATQAPAGTPASGNLELTLPSDGDAASAASIAQALKVLADFTAFARAPFANASIWSQEILAAQDAHLNKRWALDHWGLPRKTTIEWTEDFTPAPAFNATATGTLSAGRQSIVTFGAGAFTGSAQPGTTYSNPPYPASLAGTVVPDMTRQFVGVIDAGTAGNRTEIRLDQDYVGSCFGDDTLISCEWDFQNFTNLSVIWVVGFTDAGELVNNVHHGAFFIRPNAAGANWLCRTINGGAPTEVDSGILASTTMRTFRIDLVGGSVSDDSVARALFWIDGALVANISTTLAINAGNVVLPFCGGVVQSSGTTANPVFLLNAIRYRQITRISLP